MRVDPEQLEARLRQGLAPVYLLCGDEPLQLNEALDAIKHKARAAGFQERLVMDVDGQFDWNRLTGELGSLSLFSTRRIIDLRLPGGKPGREGGAMLRDALGALGDDTLLLIHTGKLDGAAYKSAWYKAVDSLGTVVQSRAVDIDRLPQWVTRRAQAKGINLDREAAGLLAERTEGNLLACDQELEKLLLVCGGGPLTADDVLAAVADNARHDLYQLADEALGANPRRVTRIVRHLRGEGAPLPLILWALGQDIRGLCTMAQAGGSSRPPAALARNPYLWKRRRPLFDAALRRHPPPVLLGLLEQFAVLDQTAKGRGRGEEPWVAVERYCLALAGIEGFMTGPAER